MLTYSFTDIGSDSLYEHLYKCIKNDIAAHKIKPGEKLPSKRSLAKNLGISVITIEKAYDQLISEGYVYSIEKKGYFASDMAATPKKTRFDQIKKEPKRKEDAKEGWIDCSNNRSNVRQFPFTVWSRLLRECLTDYQEALLLQPPSGGALRLREAIASHLHEFRGLTVSPEQIIIGAGTEYLYGQLVQLLGRDRLYGVEDPGFSKVSQVYEAGGVRVRPISLDKDGICIQELKAQKVQVAHTSPSHQFPTGKIMPISRRYELLGWASGSEERYIIEDDYDSEFRMTGKPIPTLKSIDVNEKVIYLNTFSKSLSSTIRISYMVLPHHLMELYDKKLSFYTCPVTSLIQLTVARFISEGYFEKHINRMRNYYKKQRDLFFTSIAQSGMAPYARILEADAGLHFLLRLDLPCGDGEFTQRMKKRKIKICALSEYYQKQDNKSQHEFLINYSSLSPEEIKTAVEELSKEIIELHKTS